MRPGTGNLSPDGGLRWPCRQTATLSASVAVTGGRPGPRMGSPSYPVRASRTSWPERPWATSPTIVAAIHISQAPAWRRWRHTPAARRGPRAGWRGAPAGSADRGRGAGRQRTRGGTAAAGAVGERRQTAPDPDQAQGRQAGHGEDGEDEELRMGIGTFRAGAPSRRAGPRRACSEPRRGGSVNCSYLHQL